MPLGFGNFGGNSVEKMVRGTALCLCLAPLPPSVAAQGGVEGGTVDRSFVSLVKAMWKGDDTVPPSSCSQISQRRCIGAGEDGAGLERSREREGGGGGGSLLASKRRTNCSTNLDMDEMATSSVNTSSRKYLQY